MTLIDATRRDYTSAQAECMGKALDGLAQMTKARGSLGKSTGGSDESANDLAVISGMLSHGRRLCTHLVRGYVDLDVSLCGWASRSLVELRVWNRYIWASESNRRHFIADCIIDEYEVQTIFLEFLKANANHPESATNIRSTEAELNRIDQDRWASVIGPREGRLQVKTVCAGLGLKQFYRLWFGILSKMSHPTSSLLIEIESGKEVFLVGTQSAIEIFNLAVEGLQMREHIETWINIHKVKQAA
jgi:hypothetical protein